MEQTITTARKTQHITLPVTGMTCASCVRSVERVVGKVEGVEAVAVNLATETADVTLSDRKATGAVVAAIEKGGYGVSLATVELGIGGMHCASCVSGVERALSRVPGVVSAHANLANERATVSVVPSVSVLMLEAAVEKAGFETLRVDNQAPDVESHEGHRAKEQTALKRDLLTAFAFTLPLFVLEMGSHFVPAFGRQLTANVGVFPLHLVYFVLATIVQFGPGRRFYSHGIASFRRLSPDMNALVMLGSSAAWAYSTVATFWPQIFPQAPPRSISKAPPSLSR
nr:copper ion binding protein [Marinicella sp. W31]MDC2878828.1 copper ion binding protein [Marinicella sp. W31]